MSVLQIICIVGTLFFLGIVFKLVLKKRLREEFSIIWIGCAIFLNIFTFWRNGIAYFAKLFGIFYPPAILFIVLFVALIFYCLHLSIIISKHKNQVKNLTQELSILTKRLEKLENKNGN